MVVMKVPQFKPLAGYSLIQKQMGSLSAAFFLFWFFSIKLFIHFHIDMYIIVGGDWTCTCFELLFMFQMYGSIDWSQATHQQFDIYTHQLLVVKYME